MIDIKYNKSPFEIETTQSNFQSAELLTKPELHSYCLICGSEATNNLICDDCAKTLRDMINDYRYAQEFLRKKNKNEERD